MIFDWFVDDSSTLSLVESDLKCPRILLGGHLRSSEIGLRRGEVPGKHQAAKITLALEMRSRLSDWHGEDDVVVLQAASISLDAVDPWTLQAPELK